MKEYLSYFSAVTFWNIPYIEAVLGSESVETDHVDYDVFHITTPKKAAELMGYSQLDIYVPIRPK